MKKSTKKKKCTYIEGFKGEFTAEAFFGDETGVFLSFPLGDLLPSLYIVSN